MATVDISAHLCPLLASLGSIHRSELHVMFRVWSKSPLSVVPSSPPRSSRLCASSAAAHSGRPRLGFLSYPCLASCAKCAARNALLSRRIPAGPSSISRIRFSVNGIAGLA
eukprot:4911229-Pleurochrysis_carterae.AAC.2